MEEILDERRPRTVFDLNQDYRFDNTEFRRAGVRSLLGAPIFGELDRPLGIVVTGLHAAHALPRRRYIVWPR